MNIEQIEMQKEIVIELTKIIPEDWRRIILSYEIEDHPDFLQQNTMLSYISGPVNGLEKVSLGNFPAEIKRGFTRLNKMMADTSGQTWSSCELIIDASGHYNFSFSYGPPKRINGILDEESYDRYNNYLDIYKAELAATTVAGHGKS